MDVTVRRQEGELPNQLIVPVAENKQMDAILHQVSSITGIPFSCLKNDFKANLKDYHTLYFTENGRDKRLILLGLGESPKNSDVISAFRFLCFKKKTSLDKEIAVAFNFKNGPEHLNPWVESAVIGITLGFYEIGLYKSPNENEKPGVNSDDIVLAFLTEDNNYSEYEQAAKTGLAIATTQLEIFDLVNAPANKKTPHTLAEWAVNSGKKYGYSVQIFEKAKVEALGMHALLAVNRGSETPPVFIVMEYKPKGKIFSKIGLVGKGVTFDTGGLSIKPSANMHYMKTDMGGAAAVMGSLEVAAKLNLPFHIFGAIPATENSVDAKSIRPGDVIGSYLGKTIEVIDTDAEGRLILADGLAYTVKKFKPDFLIDLATLTGSCIRTFGTYAGGLFSNNDELSEQLLASGEKTGERLWRLPLWDDYKKELKSDIADIKNFSGNPTAGAITAAKFLEMFIAGHAAWAHLDIAGVAVADSEFSSQKSATGFGIRLLFDFMQRLQHK
jgi:leucyl aminopeptidase